jgi:PilZ domain
LNDEEKRKIERFTLELPALISMNDETGKQKAFEVMTRNICAGGAFLLTDKPLPVGTNVKMDLILPLDNLQEMGARRSRIDVSGAVVRTDLQGMAVCFDKKYSIEPL